MDSDQTVKEWVAAFYREKMFSDDAEKVHWISIKLGPIKIPFLNLRQRREAIYLHDLNHLLTNYDTTWTGEGEIAAWELASGFPKKYWIGYVYPPMTFLIGLIIAPRKTVTAFKKGIGKNNIYKLQLERVELEQMKISDLKKALKISE
jgi:hypothetical protein